AVVRIERIGKHAAEFQRRHVLRQPFRFLADFLQGGIVRVSARELEELRGVREPAADAAEGADDRFERLLFLAEVLRALRVLPQLRVFELAVQRRKAPGLRLEVKDTSAAPPTAPAGRRGWRRSGSLVRLPSISLPCLPNIGPRGGRWIPPPPRRAAPRPRAPASTPAPCAVHRAASRGRTVLRRAAAP